MVVKAMARDDRGLASVDYRDEYRSGEGDILVDFFHRSLEVSTAYWRAVGYFCSSALELFGAPLGSFLRNTGTVRLITSVELHADDIAAIERGSKHQDVCERRLEEILDTTFADGVGDGITRLVKLMEMGRLEIKIATPRKGTGIYHEKVGLFFDGTNYVAFSGSANESRNALENNYECVDVFTSWDLPKRAESKKKHFERLWNYESPGAWVYPFSEAAKHKLIRAVSIRRTGRVSEITQDPPKLKWRHQDLAVELFLAKERGVLDMATGTGKTRTGLKAVAALFDAAQIDRAIISTDGNDLLDQWYKNILVFRNSLTSRPTVYRDYGGHSDGQAFGLNSQNSLMVASRDELPALLRKLNAEQGQRTLVIYDEVHGLGSPGNVRRLTGLSDHIRFRLGLSATPDRAYDTDGNDFIAGHVGPVLMRFGLEEAIGRGILVPFNYYPLKYQLTDDDKERVRTVYKRRAAKAAAGEPMTDAEVWMEIARVYKSSPAKIPVFAGFIKERASLLDRCIIFVETQAYGEAILELVHQFHPRFHAYFSGEDSETLQRFARGQLECLVTCHRLSEGIDIQSLNTVILFSSSRARLETIQRMGRCLRADPANVAKIANVVDFIREDPEADDPNSDEEREAWLTKLSSIRPEESGDET